MIRLNQRLLARLGLFVLPAALLFGAVALPGCNKDKDGTPAAAGGAATIGVVDYARVFTDLGWKTKMTQDLEATGQNYKMAFDAFNKQLTDAAKDRLGQIATAAKLSDSQKSDFLNGKIELDKLPLSQQQKSESIGISQNANAYLQAAQQDAQRMLQMREQQLNQVYLEATKAPVRKVAEANNISVVLSSNLVSYSSVGVDLTNKIVDDLRASAAGVTPPPAQKLEYKQVRLDQPPTPTPATQPAK